VKFSYIRNGINESIVECDYRNTGLTPFDLKFLEGEKERSKGGSK
jgi:hypothetical protein